MTKKKYFVYFSPSILLFFTYVLLLNSNFSYMSLKEYDPRPNFWDLHSGMINLWECYKNVGFDLFSFDSSTFPSLESCRNLNYGYFSLVSFGFTNFLNQNVVFWGYLQILIFTLLTVKTYFLEKLNMKVFIFLSALFSPGIFLLFASGNMDIQIICLLLISTFLITSKKEKTALSLICITALLKFYTAPIIVMALFLVKEKRSRTYGISLAFTTFFVIAYQMIINPLPPFPNGAQNKFGSGIFDNYIRKVGIQVSELQGEILGVILLTLSLFMIFYFHKKSSQISNIPNKLSKKQELFCINFLIMACASITCYLAALNVDYRLTFVALAGIALLQIPQTKVNFISAVFPFTWLLSLWLVFPIALLKKYIGIDLQPIGDIMMIGTISYFIFQGFYIFRLMNTTKLLSTNK